MSSPSLVLILPIYGIQNTRNGSARMWQSVTLQQLTCDCSSSHYLPNSPNPCHRPGEKRKRGITGLRGGGTRNAAVRLEISRVWHEGRASTLEKSANDHVRYIGNYVLQKLYLSEPVTEGYSDRSGEGKGKHKRSIVCPTRQGSHPRWLQSRLKDLGAKLEDIPTGQNRRTCRKG